MDVELWGQQFDASTDVHVFILALDVAAGSSGRNALSWQLDRARGGAVVGDHYAVHVGSVVDYRDEHVGPTLPYVKPRALKPWATVTQASESRRFSGRVFTPPFVAVRRTSRPGDPYRAVGAIVNTEGPVAVDNHLLVLTPRAGGIAACASLLDALKQKATNDWLNNRIRCRHLTVKAMRELPWSSGHPESPQETADDPQRLDNG